MNGRSEPARAVRVLSAVLLGACATIALANLPGAALPPGWLLAFTLPGAGLGLLSRLRPNPWLRFAAATVMQTIACYLALVFVGPMTRPAALACTILPPLAFATTRQEEPDRALALFLSFCVLLIGVILDGIDRALLGAYVACACLTLRCAAHVTAVLGSREPDRLQRPPRATGSAAAAALAVALYCLVATLAFDRALAWLPSPAKAPEGPVVAAGGRDHGRTQGLADDFVLGNGGILGGISSERLLRVRSADGEPVPTDLYLRSSFFGVPDLDRWQIGRLNALGLADSGYRRDPRPGPPVRALEIERFPGAMNFVFAPPSTCRLVELPNLTADYAREWIRQTAPRGTTYAVAFQQLALPRQREPATGPLVEPLTALPTGLDAGRWEALLTSWGADGAAATVMNAVADGLARHCRYDRADPVGPFAHALENFLFADGDRRGYCMHFASAAAIMLRLRGIPCRIGVGLLGGDPDPGEPGARLYGSQHAHAWVEVPYGELGYLVFDPTPPSERGRAMPTQPASEQARDLGPDDAFARPRFDWRQVADWLTQGWVLAIGIVFAIVVTMLPARAPRRGAAVARPPALRQARRMLATLLQQLARAGIVRSHRQTLEDLARGMRGTGRAVPEVEDAFAAYQDVRFGGMAFDAGRQARLQRGLEAAARLTTQEADVPTSGSQ